MQSIAIGRYYLVFLCLAFLGAAETVLAEAPSILTQPQSQAAPAGANLTFSVTATGSPPLEYRWRLDGKNLHEGAVFSGVHTNALVLKDIRNYQAGAYDVVVSNPEGSVTSEPAGLTLSPLSWPGHRPYLQIGSMCFENGIAYVTCSHPLGEQGLSILDVSDPANFFQLGRWGTSFCCGSVAARYPHAYVRTNTQLEVLDVSDPRDPFSVGSFAMEDYPPGGEVVLYEDRLYLAAGTHLLVLDAKDPIHLRRVGQIEVPADRVIVDGRYAYAAARVGHDGILSVVDLSPIDLEDPKDPERVTWWDFEGPPEGFVKNGDCLFLAEHTNGPIYLTVFDVKDPGNPQVISRTREGTLGHLAVYERYVLAVYYWSGLGLFDVSDPAHPNEVSSYKTSTHSRAAYGLLSAAFVDGHYAYLSTSEGLMILDIQDPANLKYVGGDLQATEVAVEGNAAYVVGSIPGLRVVDISEPLAPRHMGSYDFIGIARGVAAGGERAYVVEGDYLEPVIFHVLDVSEASKIRLLGSCGIPLVGSSWNVDLSFEVVLRESEKRAYVGAGLGGFVVVDLREESRPELIGQLDMPAVGVALEGNLAYIAPGDPFFCDYTGLHVLNVGDPTSPQPLGAWPTLVGYAYRVAVSGDYAYLADGSEGLQVLDVADPNLPRRISHEPGLPGARDISLGGSRAIVAFSGGLAVVDVRDPAKPEKELQLSTPSAALAVSVSGEHAFVANGDWGLCVVPLPPMGAGEFERGDANADGKLDLSDAVFTLMALFKGGPSPSCWKAADSNDDGVNDITDPVYSLNYLFLGGEALPQPSGQCGKDPTPDSLSCEQYGACR